jgi:hypothetical protein
MDILIYAGFVVVLIGPLVGYAIYTSLRGEPRRPEKAATGKSGPKPERATS